MAIKKFANMTFEFWEAQGGSYGIAWDTDTGKEIATTAVYSTEMEARSALHASLRRRFHYPSDVEIISKNGESLRA